MRMHRATTCNAGGATTGEQPSSVQPPAEAAASEQPSVVLPTHAQ